MTKTRKSPTTVDPDASIRDAGACREAAALLKEGQPVGSFIRGVCGLWVDGANSRAVDTIYRWLQNWLPEGCQTTASWMAELAQRGIDLPVATSMNVSGQPELVDQGEGRAFCATHGIPIFLGDPHRTSEVQGSFPIIQVDKAGIRLVREGHFSAAMFSHLLAGWEIDLTGFKPAKYPLRATHREPAVRALSPARLRAEMTARLDE